MEALTVLSSALAWLNLGLHLAVCALILQQLRAPYWFPAWTRAWLALLCAGLMILPFRVADLWHTPPAWRMLVAAPMTLALFYAMFTFAWIFRVFTHGDQPLNISDERPHHGP